MDLVATFDVGVNLDVSAILGFRFLLETRNAPHGEVHVKGGDHIHAAVHVNDHDDVKDHGDLDEVTVGQPSTTT